MKKQNGITLIALVISIIVMLILAGVSINAIVGENGVLSRVQYSSFLNEMSAVEEAVQLWKAGELIESKGQVNTAIPANGLCNVNELTSTERLVGEIGYYRTWSIGNVMPDMSILTSADSFNKKYEGEFVFYPAGVQDLYYLNNEALGLDEDKVYLIDASTSMVYSMTGITINGVRCYSLNMAKAVTSGMNTAPLFAEAEVSGTGTGGVLAGNVEEEFLPDGTKNPDYNPYGFEFIGGDYSQNLYKLYNNGELYGKGVKGLSLDNSAQELEEISQYNWTNLEVPSEIGSYKKVIIGVNTIFVIDNNDELWAWGGNDYNKLGLNNEAMKEYTGRDAVKLSIKDLNNNNVKVSHVYSWYAVTFVISTTNDVYVAGSNNYGTAGINSDLETINTFQKVVGLPVGEEVQCIYSDTPHNNTSLSNRITVVMKNGDIYFAGAGTLGNTTSKSFIQIISNSDVYDKCNSNIKKAIFVTSLYDYKDMVVLLLENGNLYCTQYKNSKLVYNKIEEFSENVKDISYLYTKSPLIVETIDNKFFYCGMKELDLINLGLDESLITEVIDGKQIMKDFIDLEEVLPSKMFANNDSIKKIINCSQDSAGTANFFYIMNSGKVWGSGNINRLGLGREYVSNTNSTTTTEIILIAGGDEALSNLKNIKIKDVLNDNILYGDGRVYNIALIGYDGNAYITGNQLLMYRNKIIQTSWKKIATDVKKVFVESLNKIAFINKNNDCYIILQDYRDVGEESISSTVEYGNNFRKITDSNLVGKVKQVNFIPGGVLILTTDSQLYSCGKGKYDSTWVKNAFSGLGTEALTKQTLLATDVKIVNTVPNNGILSGNIYINNDNEMYFWGARYLSAQLNVTSEMEGTTKIGNNIPVKVNVDDLGLDVSQIVKCRVGWEATVFIMENGNIFLGGKACQNARLQFGKSVITEVSYESLGLDGKIVDMVFLNGTETQYSSCLILTENGSIYGCGPEKFIGMNSNSANMVHKPVKLSVNNNGKDLKIAKIYSDNHCFIAIAEDGTVWGTGDNKYGILGRWIGVGRGTSNSRYKTALNWVECPELEI